MTLLSILIPSITERRLIRERLVCNLYYQLDQVDSNKVEIMICEDNRTEVYGTKLNRMMQDCKGRYLCNIDDDDLVCGTYVKDIIDTLESNSNIDLVTFKTLRVDLGEVLDYSFGCNDRDPRPNLPNGMAIRANHLMVWRKEIAVSCKLPDMFYRESMKIYGAGPEVVWYDALHEKYKDKVLREVHINKILYLYFYDPLISTSKE